MKRIFCALFGAIFSALVCCVCAFAEKSGEWEYTAYDDGTAMIIGYSGNADTADVPSELDGHTVTVLKIFSFNGHNELNTVNIPPTVTSIYEESEQDYEFGIKEFIVDELSVDLYSVDGVIFSKDMSKLIAYPMGNERTEYAVPEGVSRIYPRAFYRAKNLVTVSFPDSFEAFNTRSFEGCSSLNTVKLAKTFSVEEFLSQDFYSSFIGCDSFEQIDIEKGGEYESVDGVLYSSDKTALALYPRGKKDRSYTVPSGVEEIMSGAFSGSLYLEQVIIPDSVGEIGVSAFKDCAALSDVQLPDSIMTLPLECFEGCASLKSVDFPEGLTYIDMYAFKDSGIESVYITDNILTVGSGAYFGCNRLTEFTVSDNSQDFYVKDGVLYQDRVIISYPAGKKDKAFVIPDDTEYLTYDLFNGNKYLEEVTLSDNITEIEEEAFLGCTALKKLNNGKNVKKIGVNAFTDTALLSSGGDPVKYVGNWAVACDDTAAEAVVRDGTTVLAEDIFRYCEKLTKVVLPKGIERIPSGAFAYCYSLKSVSIPDTVTNIDYGAFLYCKALESVTFPDSVTKLGSDIFDGCRNLKSFVFPKDITEVPTFMFSYCYSLDSVSLPHGLKTIDSYAFEFCTALTAIHIPDGTEEIKYNAFNNCASLNSIIIPESTTVIDDNTFNDCESLSTVVIHDNVTEIGEEAFSGCGALKTVYYAGSEEQWSALVVGEGNDILSDIDIIFDTPKLEALKLINEPDKEEDKTSDGFGGASRLSIIIASVSVGLLLLAGILKLVKLKKHSAKVDN